MGKRHETLTLNRTTTSLPAAPAVQVVTSSHDKTVRLWDLRMGKTLATLTHHKKASFHLVEACLGAGG